MTIRHMRIFIQVYQAQNVTKAAQLLHMTQPAVTRAIQELERYYGVQLFDRVNRHLVVTETGRELFQQAVHIVDSFDSLEKELHNWDTLGVLRVGASITIGNHLLPRLITRFQQQLPHIRLDAEICNSAALQAALMESRLDLALIENTVDHPDLLTRAFSHDHLTLITPPDHPLVHQPQVSLADLTRYPFIMREPGSAGRTFVDHCFAANNIVVRPAVISVSTQAIVQCVHAGVGIALLPDQLVVEDVAAGRVCACSIADAPFVRQHFIVWHRSKYVSPLMQRFMALCDEVQESDYSPISPVK